MNKEYLAYKERLDFLLDESITSAMENENLIYSVMKYGIETPGKRIRGALLMAFCSRMGVEPSLAEPFAVALEMIHAYSLVHDDMPEMDNDDFRRGLPTCHKKFGPAFALLGGDGILNYSVEYLLRHRDRYLADRFLAAMDALYDAAGGHGMLGGQIEDILGEEKNLTLEELHSLHLHKTGALLMAPARIALALSGRDDQSAIEYSRHLGLAFQIKDDLLDVEGNAAVLGKEIGKDKVEEKSTFVSILGVSKARLYLNNEIKLALASANGDEFLCWLAEFTAKRNK